MPRSSTIFLLLGGLVGIFGCYEKKEGCLDVLAGNFSLEADIDCCENADNCCCEYPMLSFSLKHQFGEGNLSTNQTYSNKLGQTFEINQIQFFISQIRLVEGSSRFALDDSLEIVGNNGQTVLKPDDITVVETGLFSVKFGAFKRPGSYDQLEFVIGLDEPERSASRDQFDSGHPLAENDLRDTLENQWLLYDITWVPDTLSGVADHLRYPADTTILITLPVNISKDPGENVVIPLSIDYSKWFDQIDILGDDKPVIHQKILSALAGSFQIL